MKKQPLVTIAIPAFNNIKFFKQALISVINQTYTNIEILVIDDGTDDSIEAFLSNQSFTIPLLYKKNKTTIGYKKNFDKCWELANGQYVMILHQDDILLPSLVEKYIEVFAKNNSIGAVCCQTMVMDEENIIFKKHTEISKEYDLNLFLQDFFSKGHPEIATLMVQSNLVKNLNKLHFFHEDNPFYDDYYFWLDLAFRTNIYFLSGDFFIRRVHSNQASAKEKKKKENFFIERCHYIEWVIKKTADVIDINCKKYLYNWSMYILLHSYLLYYNKYNKMQLRITKNYIMRYLGCCKYIQKKIYILSILSLVPYPIGILLFNCTRSAKKYISRFLFYKRM